MSMPQQYLAEQRLAQSGRSLEDTALCLSDIAQLGLETLE